MLDKKNTPTISHIDKSGKANMVDVSAKSHTLRKAVAQAFVSMEPSTQEIALKGDNPKGEVFNSARIAGIMAAKQTSNLIPLCHNIFLQKIEIDISPTRRPCGFMITANAQTTAQTGVEMEALTAASITALTIYDMLKAVQKSITIENIALIEKTGGKSAEYKRKIK